MSSDLHTLLLTDVVDSTKLSLHIGDAAMVLLWAAHDRAARDLLPVWRGREIDKTDGMLLLFDATSDAVGYAMAYQQALSQLDPPLPARAGLHVGPVTLRENSPADMALGAKPIEVEGVAKATAARVMSVATGGQILLSADARRRVDADGLRLLSHGHWRLKGLDEPIELFETGDTHAPWTPPPDGDKGYRVVRQGGFWRPVREIPHSLPAEGDAFVGRVDALAELALRIHAGARLVSVLGVGGTGKTRLALRYGQSWLGEFPGGVWFCDLAPARSVDGIASAVAQGLDVALGKDDPVKQLGHAIAGRDRCLVILDNFEQVARYAAPTLGHWLARAGQARFVVTTREVLGLAGEVVLALPPLPPADGEALFVQRAEAANPQFQCHAENQRAIVQLVELLDGLPLAIELAAARVRVMPPRMLLARMNQRFKLLTSQGGRLDRQSTLRAAFDWSWDLLSLPEKAALAQLSVFEGGFTLEAAEAVIDLSTCDAAPWTVDVVQALVDKSFVRPRDDGRFDLLVSVQAYAADHLRTSSAYAWSGPSAQLSAERCHGVHFSAVAADPAAVPATADQDNLTAACRRAVARGDTTLAARLLNGAWSVLTKRGPFRAALMLADLVHAMPGLAGEDRVTAGLIRGFALERTGRTAEALQHLQAAAQGAQLLGLRRPQARALHRIAQLQAQAGALDAARAAGAQAQLLAEGDPALQCAVLNSVGAILDTTGHGDAARQHYEQALRIARAEGVAAMEALSAGNLAQWLSNHGRPDLALPLYHQALAQARAVGNRQWEGNTRCNLGLLHQTEGRLAEAQSELEASRTIAQDLGDLRLLGFVLCNLGLLAETQGDMARAAAWQTDAAALARELGDRRFEGLCLAYLGRAKSSRGAVAEAEAALDAAESLLRATGDRHSLVIALCARAETTHGTGRADAALKAMAEAESLAAELAPVLAASELGQTLARTRMTLTGIAPAIAG